jgi:DNA-3-methyladenine glycosylase I
LELGFTVLKPDIVLSRIFFRLGLVDSQDDNSGVIEAGRKIAVAAKEPIRYIDIIFVLYGQVGEKPYLGLKTGICLEKNPKCKRCDMYNFCTYERKKKQIE